MSEHYPGLHNAVGHFVKRYLSTTIATVPLATIFGLPALVVAFAASHYVIAIPDYSAGYVFISLVAIIVTMITSTVDESRENDIDTTELNQSQIRTLFAVLTISTVLMIGSVMLIAGAVATLAQYALGIGYVSASIGVGLVFLDKTLSHRNPKFSIGSWGFRAGLEISHAYFTLRHNSGGQFDDEVEQSARQGGPML